MNIERLISNHSNPDPVIRQRYSQLPQMLSCIDTTSRHHKGRLTSSLIHARQTSPTQRGYSHHHHQLRHSSHHMLQSSVVPPISLHHQQIAPAPQSAQMSTLESEIQNFKQSCENPTTPNASTTPPPLASPAMSTKSNNTNGNLSLPPMSVTLPASSSPIPVQMHENASDSSVFALQMSVEKNMQQHHHADQWRSPPCQSHYQQRNYQRTFGHPMPRFHSQYHNENLKSDWNYENVGNYSNQDHDKAYQYHRLNQNQEINVSPILNQDNLSQPYRQR
ncbi:3525_t:CDS:2 [Funneliformis geosporum]|uniref:13356_t:CDS:1 n=1 Tax=Funneliformis geosporum TaxID=1117311 RepID=A0A9W4SDF9_9GLOM|nr:13356_t:CDS:2 [Funneliformis geosporum]CAI2163387.1 3525_t:CDS:2 [Funneliformis geosporum]